VQIAKNIANSNNSHYVSGARSLLRLMWFLDYVGTLLGNLLAHPEVTSLQVRVGRVILFMLIHPSLRAHRVPNNSYH
jgi:predicted branched-subunit amino acid permease